MAEKPPLPVVRNLILCEEITNDPEFPKRVSLLRLITKIRTPSTPPFPALLSQFAAFAQLANCRGTGELQLAIHAEDQGAIVYRTPPQRVNFPNNPLAVHGIAFRFTDIVIHSPGLYWVQLWFDTDMLTQQPFTVTA